MLELTMYIETKWYILWQFIFQFQHFKRLTKDTKKSAFKSNMVESSKNLYRILQRFGGEIGQEKVWSNYMLLLKCYELRNENQTDQGARKTQVSQM